MDPDYPNIWISKDEKIGIRSPSRNTLIVKLLRWTIDYNILLRKMSNLWRPKGGMDLVAIDNGYFFMKFASTNNYDYAMFGGLW